MNDTNDAPAAFAVAGGSVTGRHHRRLDRGSQDAWATGRGAGAVVAAACDGCGSGRRSEVGAALGAQLWVRAVVDLVATGAAIDDPSLWQAARARVVAVLASLVEALAGDDGDARTAALVDHGLFTSLVAAITDTHAVVYAVGDGMVAIDGRVVTLAPDADNQPPYVGYDLLGAAPPPSLFDVHRAADVGSIVLATDGAAELELAPFWSDPRFVRNPDAIRRRLAVINQERIEIDPDRGTLVRSGAPLGDDTTVVVLRRSAS